MTDSRTSRHIPKQPRTLAITGGKGGVGKTSVALNLSLTLAREGYRVLLLDGDTDLANVSIMLGRYPERTLANVMAGECSLRDVIMEAEWGLHIIPGASGVEQCVDMAAEESLRVLKALSRLEKNYDYVITDTASGLQKTGMHMIAAAELACVVVTPDPASLTDAFSLIKLLIRRGYRRTPSVLVNMAQGASQARSVFQRLDAAAVRHLGLQLHYLGAIWRDETLRQSVMNQRPVALLPASDPSSRQFRTLADMLNVRLRQLPPRKAGIAAYWHRVSSGSADTAPASGGGQAKTPKDPAQECKRLTAELGEILADSNDKPLLRYEAFQELFALLGRKMDADAIEIIQTGLASLNWDKLEKEQREHMATHLRHLAAEVDPAAVPRKAEAIVNKPEREPYYDRISFGEQSRLIRALKEQPSNISLDQLLRSLADTDKNGS
ncbi:MinD-like ATPase involved in chromosome partitioning or flagellar assembly [Marinobacter salarius]|jgi:MinD-like ATPase involved in chromosome partitioning or flagellar assembly|uniref:MinD-like ATPase involved in chromosome partitioning or flagellar assembly n=1 Tax=Marinobacter salarius TaxID=1420917 RepID=A0ABY1FLM9_9GAMM|nr:MULTISPECIES: AAA family ATPase [Marinobacter]KXJ48739.1 MAG: ATPase [Marinobacter sp. Hex_13]MBL82804.1 MinD/ParA family protein [Marinobacter sp.]MBS8229717.1 MinD/ParA family protein [Marinobacter salarius]SFL57557.1 MinD-like ATPase involved in chromosome partitioning or flagellar assembly [Marinobacter salarius]|tara:strand:+ start:2093 stop:3406 length:1314 start_codon:yes stop_codon:yes gene_type:complete